MTYSGVTTILIILITGLISFKGFTDRRFLERYSFEIDKVLLEKDYKRLITSGFLHLNWLHLIFNMIVLYAFSNMLEHYLGGFRFLLIYFSSIVGGNLLALLIHRHHGDYSCIGASGGVNGIVFASIALFPDMGIGFFFIPISIPAWVYGIICVAFSVYAIKSRRDNIGHEAHLGGALIGMVIAVLMEPSAISENYLPILLIGLPTIAFIFVIGRNPGYLLVDNPFSAKNHFYNIDHKYNFDKMQEQSEIDRILDKINRRGINSLTKIERQRLKDYSKVKS